MKLHSFQRRDFAAAACRDGVILSLEQGLGKSFAAFTIPYIWRAPRVLIVAPGDLHSQLKQIAARHFAVPVTSLATVADLYSHGIHLPAAPLADGGMPRFFLTTYEALTRNGADEEPEDQEHPPLSRRRSRLIDARSLAKSHALARLLGYVPNLKEYFVGIGREVGDIPANRQLMREALIARYFPQTLPIEKPKSSIDDLQSTPLVADESLEFGRSPAFRRKILDSRHDGGTGSNIGNFRTAKYLKILYVLMHRYIRASEDINRAGKGVYSPELRDDAQDARNRLFNLLSEVRGKETYIALKELIKDHPDPNSRPWMAKMAYKRAEEDGELEPWTAEQVAQFAADRTQVPTSHRQLFDIGVARLIDLKNWLERGNDSPFLTWRRASGETEMRNLVAGWLNTHSGNRFTCAQENELSNKQRPDIFLQSSNVRSAVPIELKLLDKNWTGPKLCERLKNQMAGDYLREETAGCGVMLLVWQGPDSARKWQVKGERVGISGLRDALTDYWESISDSFPNVSVIEVIVVDLTLRSLKANC